MGDEAEEYMAKKMEQDEEEINIIDEQIKKMESKERRERCRTAEENAEDELDELGLYNGQYFFCPKCQYSSESALGVKRHFGHKHNKKWGEFIADHIEINDTPTETNSKLNLNGEFLKILKPMYKTLTDSQKADILDQLVGDYFK
jgi:hypothetical protein